MLSDEGFSSDAINKAMKSSSFIFFNSDIIKEQKPHYSLLEYPVHPYTKYAFHEIGHAFSEKASLHGDYDRMYALLTKEIENIELNVNNFDDLFGTPGTSDVLRKPGNLERIKNLQLDYLREVAREEARAEGFSHQVLAQIGKDDILPQGSQLGPDSQNLLDEYVSQKIEQTKLSAQIKSHQAAEKAKNPLRDKTIPIIARQDR